MSGTFTKRDRETARYTHKLFWEANFVDWVDFVIWCLTRPPALLIYNVIIPFEIAYGLQAIITRHFGLLGHYSELILLWGLAYCVLWGVGGVVICRNGRVGTTYIQRRVFINYLEKDYEFFNNTYLGTLGAQATRLRNVFNDYCTIFMNGVAKQLVVVITSIAVIAWQSVALAVTTLISLAIVMSFTVASSKWRLKYRRLLSEADSETAGVIGDALGHGTTVKSFAAEDYEKERLEKSLKNLAKMQFWSWMTSIPGDIGRGALATIATVVLLVMTGRLYEHRSISIALVILVQLYVIKLIMATQEITELIKAYEAVMSGAHQAVKTMLLKPILLDRPNARKLPRSTKFDITMTHVNFRYPDAPEHISAIKDFNLRVAQGEKIGLVGYSGSGKTTLTRLLLRFMDITDGSIQIGGLDIRDLAQRELRRHISYVSQEPLLFHRSIAENISYGRPRAGRKAVELAAETAYVREFVDELASGYDTLVGEKGVKLSGGQRQRVAIARALLKNAPILILDEATSALDSQSEKYIQKALWRLMEGRTALVIAHRLSTIQRMDRIVVMDKGRIVEIGSHDELLNNKTGIYAKLWAHQSGGYLVTQAT